MVLHSSKRLLATTVATGSAWVTLAQAASSADALPFNATASRTGKSNARFIISYRNGSAEAGDDAMVLQDVDVAMSRLGLATGRIGTCADRYCLRRLVARDSAGGHATDNRLGNMVSQDDFDSFRRRVAAQSHGVGQRQRRVARRVRGWHR